jgi:hypothetical protein
LTPSATATVFSPDWRRIRSDTPRRPFSRAIVRSVGHAVFDAGDVAQVDHRAPALGDHDRAELLGGDELALGPERPFPPPALQAAAGKLDVLALHRGEHVAHGQAVPAEPQGVDPDPDLPLAGADQRDAAHAGNALEPRLDAFVGELAQGPDRMGPGDDHRHDRDRVRIDAQDDRGLGVGRQLAAHGGDLVAHLLGLLPDVVFEVELDDQERQRVARLAAQGVDPLDGVDRLLEDL